MGTGREIAVIEPQETAIAYAVEVGTLTASTPAELIEGATAIATPLARLIDQRGLAKPISGRRYVAVEGWTTLAVMLGVTPHEVDVVERDGVFTATIELRTMKDGRVLSRASAECGASDEVWGKRPRFARRSMALTRATGKACRLAFSWIMVLAGYEGTPQEEMDGVEVEPAAPRRARQPEPERASAGDIDIISQLLKAPIAADVVKQVNKRIAKGMTPEQAEKCIAHLRGLIAQLDSDEKAPEPDQPKEHSALTQARAVYNAELKQHRADLDYDKVALAAWEEAVMGRPSSESWSANEFLAAAQSLENGEGPTAEELGEAA